MPERKIRYSCDELDDEIIRDELCNPSGWIRCVACPEKKYPLGTNKRSVLDFLNEMENIQDGDDDNGIQF